MLASSPFILAAVVLAALAAVALAALSWRGLAGATRRQRVVLTVGRLLLFAVAVLGVADLVLPRAGARTVRPYLALLLDASNSMSIPDGPGGQTRLEAALGQLQAAGLPDQLGEQVTVVAYAFGQGSQLLESIDSLRRGEAANRVGSAGTDMAAAVGAPLEQLGAQRLAAIVLVSDGQDTQGAAADDIALAARGVPVHTVGVGKAERPRDLELAHVLAPKEVARGEEAEVVAQLRAYGYDRAQANVILRRGDRQIATKSVELTQGERRRLQFRTRPREVGLFRYSVRAEPLADELTTHNNERSFFLRVTQGERKVLLVDRPRQEFAALRRAVAPLEKLALTIYLKKAPQEGFWREQPSPKKGQSLPRGAGLAQYDAVVIGDMAPSDLGREFLAEVASLVRSKGLGLGVLGGPRGLGQAGYADTPVSSLLPFSAAGGSYQPAAAQARLSDAGEDHPALAALRGEVHWAGLPALTAINVLGSLPPGARALLTADLPGRGGHPLLGVRRVGSAKVLALATDSTWRWVRSEHAGQQSAAAHGSFWRALIWWLATIEAERGVSVQLDRDTYTVGAAVRLVVTVRDDDFTPVSDARVTAVIAAPDGSEHEVACYAVPDAPGRYEGTYRAAAQGAHKLTVKASPPAGRQGAGTADLGSASREFAVEPQVEEFRHPEMNRPLLEEVAERSGGAYLPLDRVGELADLIGPRAQEMAAAQPPLPAARRVRLAHTWPYLVLFMVLAALDWGLRRRWGLG